MTEAGATRPPLLIVTLSLDVGGAERHIAAIAPGLKRLGWPISIYCTNRLGAFSEEVRASGIDVIGPPIERRSGMQRSLTRFLATAAATGRLRGVLRRLRPTITHFFLPEPYIFGAPLALMQQVPITVMSRRGLNLYQQNWPGAAAIERRLHNRMTAVLANSRRVAADLEAEGCAPGRIGLIYNGVAIEGLSRPVDRAAVRRELGIAEDALLMIVVANLIGYKGHLDLVEALAGLRARMPAPWTLLCIGRDEGARAEIEARARSLGLAENIKLVGVRSDVARLLGASDLSILPSHQEGFSNAIIEAMAAGLPLVVTDVGGNGEAVVDGGTGFVVPPHDPLALGAAILRLVDDPQRRRQFGRAGALRAEQHYSMATCIESYDRLYLGLLGGRQASEIAPVDPLTAGVE